jgi:hypothetical protein
MFTSLNRVKPDLYEYAMLEHVAGTPNSAMIKDSWIIAKLEKDILQRVLIQCSQKKRPSSTHAGS